MYFDSDANATAFSGTLLDKLLRKMVYYNIFLLLLVLLFFPLQAYILSLNMFSFPYNCCEAYLANNFLTFDIFCIV